MIEITRIRPSCHYDRKMHHIALLYDTDELGQRIRALRREKGLRQDELADLNRSLAAMIDSLKARVDAVAAALQYSKPTVEDISNLEIAYAPPFASAMDVVNVVANVADNALAGRFTPVTADQFMDMWQKRSENHVFFIDSRPAAAGKAVQEKHPDWHAIPLEEIAARINEVPKDRPVAIICNTGLRAYDSLLVLARNGVTDVVNSTGGMQAAIKMGLSV